MVRLPGDHWLWHSLWDINIEVFSYWNVHKQNTLSDPQLKSMLWSQHKWLSEGLRETEAIPAGVPAQRA